MYLGLFLNQICCFVRTKEYIGKSNVQQKAQSRYRSARENTDEKEKG